MKILKKTHTQQERRKFFGEAFNTYRHVYRLPDGSFAFDAAKCDFWKKLFKEVFKNTYRNLRKCIKNLK